MTVFILEDALSVWTNLCKHLLLVWLFVSSIKTGTRRIIRLDELSSVIRLERRTTENRLSRGIIRLVPVFIQETNNQTNNKCLPKFVQTDNASSSIKTANLVPQVFVPYCAGLTKRASRPLVKENEDWVRGYVKDGDYYCYRAYVLRISRYSGFLRVVLTNIGIFLRELKLCRESRT